MTVLGSSIGVLNITNTPLYKWMSLVNQTVPIFLVPHSDVDGF